ncbi:MAG: glycosyltransferase, partial [Lentisphaeria bacterium]|nr:glycosyltransferase [Lentisphaeria bacterium]
MNGKRLSIVIPTIGRQILDKTIESALVQTLPPYELVVWDNSGTGSAKTSSKYAEDPRIRWEVS